MCNQPNQTKPNKTKQNNVGHFPCGRRRASWEADCSGVGSGEGGGEGESGGGESGDGKSNGDESCGGGDGEGGGGGGMGCGDGGALPDGLHRASSKALRAGGRTRRSVRHYLLSWGASTRGSNLKSIVVRSEYHSHTNVRQRSKRERERGG